MTDLLAEPGSGPILDAATVVLLRDTAAGPECLMLHKNQGQAFGGLWVFPGGRVETGDGEGFEGARLAAVREAAEETGLVIASADLLPISHWTPPTNAPKRYRTWFFVAGLPDGAAEVIVDGYEIGDHVWTRPEDAFARHRAGEIDLLPPTWMTLRRLADHADVAATLADAAAEPVEMFNTRMHIVSGDSGKVMVALWSGDAAYEAAADPTDTSAVDLGEPGPRRRLYMDPAGWHYEHETVA